MDEAPIEGAGAVEAGPVDGGEAGSETIEQPGGEPEPSRQYVEVEDPDNRFVRVKVDGEDVEVPYTEALRGYSREADYTRKAQDVARQRQEAEFGLNLQRALESNPAMTLQILQQQYGINLGAQAPGEPEEPEYADPLERLLHEERAAREALEYRFTQRESDEALDRVVTGLRQQFQLSDDDLREVIGTAYQLGAGIEQLPFIYKAIAFDRVNARVQAVRADQERRAQEDQRRQASAANASALISTNTTGSNGLTTQVAADGNMTIRQAIEIALREHGVT
jgi:hypothetical protein